MTSAGSLGSGTYIYDGNGLRVERTSSGTTTAYVFSGSKVIAEYTSGAVPGSPAKEYVYSGSDSLAELSGGTTTYVHRDHLSARVLTDSNGNTIGQQGHYPFGESWYSQNTTTKWQFTSYERDAESANDYATARSYVNRLGRFLSPDLLGGDLTNPQSLNLYTYALNDPCSLIDPLGLKPCTVTVRINIKHKAVTPDELKIIQQRVQDVFAATTTDNGDTFNVTFTDTGKADFSINVDPNIDFSEAGHTTFFGPFTGTPVVHAGSERAFYTSGNDAAVALGTDVAHELTHKIGRIHDLPYNGSPNLMNVDDATNQIDQGRKDNPNFTLPKGDLYDDRINANVKDFAKLTPKQVQRLIDKSHCKEPSGFGSAVGDLPRPPPYRREDD